MIQIKKDFAVNALKRILEIQETHQKLRALGVDLIEYENGVNLLEEAVSILICEKEGALDDALEMVQWWLYNDVEKVITINGSSVDVETPEAFVDWALGWYGG